MSQRCLLNREHSGVPVCPTQIILHRVHMTPQIKFFVWQVPPFSALILIFRLELVISSVIAMSLQSLHFPFPHGSVVLLFSGVSSSDMTFFTSMFFSDLGRLQATIGVEVKISFAFRSFSSRWKCFLSVVGRRDTFGCQLQTNINCGSLLIFSVSSNNFSRGIFVTSWIVFFKPSGLYPLFSKNDERVAQLDKNSSF